MNAYDFSVHYLAGLVFLEGGDPYSVFNFRYPFPVAYFWALMALPGYNAMPLMFILWGVFNLGLLIHAFRKDFWKWIFFFPVIHEFSAGQVELLYWTLERHIKPGWRGAILGALITMKPQTAIILLPWHLLHWLRYDRATLAKWVLCTGVLWGFPHLWYPNWFHIWLVERGGDSNLVLSAANSNGVFTLMRLTGVNLTEPLPTFALALFIVLAAVATIIFLIGQFQPSKEIAKACAVLANPFGLLYTQLTLMGTAPAWLLVPVNLITVGLSLTIGNFVPVIAVPIAVIIWNLRQQRKTAIRAESASLPAAATGPAPATRSNRARHRAGRAGCSRFPAHGWRHRCNR